MKNFFEQSCTENNNINNNNNNNNNNNLLNYSLQMLNNSNSNFGQDMIKTSNLINELIELEQQNKIQVELIRRIIQNKYQNINYVNNILENYISQTPRENTFRELLTNTKTCSNSNPNSQEGNNNNNNNSNNKQGQTFNLSEDRQQLSKNYFYIFFVNLINFLNLLYSKIF